MSISVGRNATVSEELRSRLVALADQLAVEAEEMPEAEKMPGLSAFDIGSKQIDRVLAAPSDRRRAACA